MIFSLLILIFGLAMVAFGAECLVRGAASLARRFGISSLVVGLTIVAFGTSMPEFVVNLVSAFHGVPDIGIGTILGSNIFNILFILGIASVIRALRVEASTVWRQIPFALLAAVVLFAVGIDGMLGRVDALILLTLFLFFSYYIFRLVREGNHGERLRGVVVYSPLVSIFAVVAGTVFLFFGGNLLVTGAAAFARLAGLSDALIGLTVVTVGTSIPELATSVIAAYRRESDIAVGTIVGSNIFNGLFILGVTGVVRPMPISHTFAVDVAVGIGSTLLLFVAMFVGKKHVLERWQGAAMLMFYVLYAAFVFARG